MSVPDWMIDTTSPSVDDMAALIRRLVRSLRKAAPGHALADQALDYLARVGLTADILRDTTPPAKAPAQEHEAARHVKDGAGYVLVPLRMTSAMRRATEDEGWQWEDLLAAAEVLSESDYEAISRNEPSDAEIRESFTAYGVELTDAHLKAVREIIGNVAPAEAGSREINEGKDSSTYRSWLAMRTRCSNPARENAARYLDRGVRVCERWASFEHFLSDMGPRPEGCTLDRWPNKSGDYEPGNCRWATPREQARNTRNSILTIETATEVARLRLAGVACKVIAARFGISESLPRAIVSGRCWPDALQAAKDESR